MSDIAIRTLFISGPTGLGKTAAAVELARRWPVEIISADSMQVYRGMEIGTAQPTAAERAAARFHVCGQVEPGEHFDAARFVELCDAAHAEITARGRIPVYVGGTGMYLRALRWGLLSEGRRDPQLRRELEAEIEREGTAAMHARLAAVDPASAGVIMPGDAIRIVRALEFHMLTGESITRARRQWERPVARFAHRMVVLVAGRSTIDQRIARRCGLMLEQGWVEEVRQLLERGLGVNEHCFKALGYREIADYLNGGISREALEAAIVLKTRRFAKRQMTWFRRESPAIWLNFDDLSAEGIVECLEKLLDKHLEKLL